MPKSKITEIFACITTDENGSDAIIAVPTPVGLLPLMGSTLAEVPSALPAAQHVADATGVPVRIMRSTSLELIQTLHPRAEP